MPVGTYDIKSLLSVKFQSAKAFGLNTISEVLQRDLAVHNGLMLDMVEPLCEITTDAQRIYGTSTNGVMTEVDDFGRAPTVRQDVGDTVAFPLRRYQYAIGWNADWFEKKTPADMAQAVLDAEVAHRRQVVLDIKKAIFQSANYTFRDYLVDYINLGVKRFVNADSARIPNGAYGITFDGSTHTHYVANATLTAAFFTSSIQTLLEHGHGGSVRAAFNFADEATVRGVTGFTAYIDPRIIRPADSKDVANQGLDVVDIYDRPIGLYGAAEVWIKPWIPAGYAFIWSDSPQTKPLAFRQQKSETLQGLRVPVTFDAFPLHAEYMQSEFGVGVWNRTNGVVVRHNNGTYADPTLTA